MTLLSMVQLSGAFMAGMALGGIFFWGLWWTVRHTLSSVTLGLSLIASFLLRVSLVLAGFYAVWAGDWRRLLACFLGFLLARLIVIRLVRTADGPIEVSDAA